MNEFNNVRFVEDNGKWLWKRYDESGSVIYRSPSFDTERLAKEDYELNGEKVEGSPESIDTVSDGEESTVGTATTPEESTDQSENNSMGSATL